MSTSTSDTTPGKDGGPGPAAPTPAAGKKTNVCLICGIYTNLSLNIFEPRNGPNIIDVIQLKYNFKAERSDSEDKYICFSCNNWLINWYSLQHLSETRNYESTPSSSRQSQSENRNKRPKNNGRSSSSAAPGSSRDKENLEQENVVSSTVKSPEKENASPKRKPKRPSGAAGRPVLKLSSQHNMISSSTGSSGPTTTTINSTTLVKPFESHLIRMLENQGTSVIKESKLANPFRSQIETSVVSTGKRSPGSQLMDSATNNSDIVLSFNSAISEVVDVLSSLRHDHLATSNENEQIDQDFLRTHRMSRSLSISLIETATTSLASATTAEH
uniref:ZAD domain-containing protein n=1 Tax=Culex tarsalis TaxID=7177 RepID=A0A1Q3EYI6_CULTA